MKRKHILTSLFLLLASYPVALAQSDRTPRLKMADAARVHEPAWVLEEERDLGGYSEDCKCEMGTLTWKRAWEPGGTVLVFVYTHKSGEDARATYESIAESYGLEETKDVSRPALWIERLKAREAESQGVKVSFLLFMRGRATVVLWGLNTGHDVAERFASIIAAELPAV